MNNSAHSNITNSSISSEDTRVSYNMFVNYVTITCVLAVAGVILVILALSKYLKYRKSNIKYKKSLKQATHNIMLSSSDHEKAILDEAIKQSMEPTYPKTRKANHTPKLQTDSYICEDISIIDDDNDEVNIILLNKAIHESIQDHKPKKTNHKAICEDISIIDDDKSSKKKYDVDNDEVDAKFFKQAILQSIQEYNHKPRNTDHKSKFTSDNNMFVEGSIIEHGQNHDNCEADQLSSLIMKNEQEENYDSNHNSGNIQNVILTIAEIHHHP